MYLCTMFADRIFSKFQREAGEAGEAERGAGRVVAMVAGGMVGVEMEGVTEEEEMVGGTVEATVEATVSGDGG